ncbi:hypothetical protein IFM89_004969 [Coptis chinensis]|uniref:Uncharacterized protein n=1 Tax=Coptis chinensis TaxID=261450 RepID=A0A835HTY2_9MAGN|nr:hypothetical protein IFM89_004969 [Coptis chinensis]
MCGSQTGYEETKVGSKACLPNGAREIVQGLESIVYKQKVGGGGDDLGKERMMEDWVKQFEELAGSQILYRPGATTTFGLVPFHQPLHTCPRG